MSPCCGWQRLFCFSEIDTTFKASRLFVGLFVSTFDFTTFDFWPFIVVKTGDLRKKSEKVAKNCDILPISRFYHPKMPEIPRNQTEIQPPAGVLCVVRAVCAAWRVRRSIPGVSGVGGILIRVNRKTALRGLHRVLSAYVIRSASLRASVPAVARCGAV